MSDALLLVVKHDFVAQIFAGTKKADLRVDTVDSNTRYVLMYNPASKAVVGGFVAERIFRKPTRLLWKHVEGRGIPKARFENYLRARKEGTAILIGEVERFDPPIHLKDIRHEDPDFFVPVSFASLRNHHPLLRMAASRSAFLRELLATDSQSSLFAFSRDEYRLRGIKPEELSDFSALVQDVVGGSYDDIDATFTAIITTANAAGHDPLGYFTLTKRIWVAADSESDTPLGYIVTTEKRGGSVKFGPTIIKPDFQGRGLAGKLRRQLDDMYAQRGFRKAYSTIPVEHIHALKYLTRAGYSVEAQLSKHYRQGRDEFVLGRVLARGALIAGHSPTIAAEPRVFVRRDAPSIDELHGILQERVSPYYDQIDRTFAESILLAHERYKSSAPWADKAKQIFSIRTDDGDLAGVLVGTPKRGGSVKISPIASRVGPSSLSVLLNAAEDFFFAEGNRKVYALTPAIDSNLIVTMIGRSYVAEGILREPYRAGADMIVYSRLGGKLDE